MIEHLLLVAAGILPPPNGVRFVEADPLADVFPARAFPVEPPPKSEPAPKKLARLPGWTPATNVTAQMRRWAEKVLLLNDRLGAFVIRRFGKREVLARVELHQHKGGPVHRGVTLYVRRPWAQ